VTWRVSRTTFTNHILEPHSSVITFISCVCYDFGNTFLNHIPKLHSSTSGTTFVTLFSDDVSWYHTATHCNTLQHTATHINTWSSHLYSVMTFHGTTLQHTATHCNTLQHTSTREAVLFIQWWRFMVPSRVMRHIYGGFTLSSSWSFKFVNPPVRAYFFH